LEINQHQSTCALTIQLIHLISSFQWRTGVNVLKRNSVRLAEVWLDDYKKYYYQRIGDDLVSFSTMQDISIQNAYEHLLQQEHFILKHFVLKHSVP